MERGHAAGPPAYPQAQQDRGMDSPAWPEQEWEDDWADWRQTQKGEWPAEEQVLATPATQHKSGKKRLGYHIVAMSV